ncbi:Uncharacterised protein g3700 [Pycnogonum litorale]
MKLFGKYTIASSVIVFICSILLQLEIINVWTTKQNVLLNAKLDDVYSFVLNADYMEKWLPFATHIRAADNRPVGLNKKYFAIFEFPIVGPFKMLFNTVEYEHKYKIILESDSFLKTRFSFAFHNVKSESTKLNLQVTHQRPSLLFQYTIGPIIQLVTYQQVQHSLFKLRLIFPY